MFKFEIKNSKGHKFNRGFTLVELLVSVGIFVFMTALLVAKYGNFNQSVLLTNLAYDVALTLRTAQTYGLSVRGASLQESTAFQYSYGVLLSHSSPNDTKFELLAFRDNSANVSISTYNIKRGAKISDVCAGDGDGANPCDRALKSITIKFTRPDPDANICRDWVCDQKYGRITLQGTDGSKRYVVVRSTGQIEVLDE